MIDFARITIKAGNGGSGSGSRTQIKGKRYAKADGGDGGRGGNVYFLATTNLNTLEPYRFLKHYEAQNGENGSSNLRHGAIGRDLELKVPVGTQIKIQSDKPQTNLSSLITNHSPLITDLVALGDRVLVARGGEGGRGNAHLRDEFGRRPKSGESGQEGERLDLVLELKLIAQVGLIGLPNAGKSTLLSKLTRATPKIASYPFTTLEPNLGVLDSLWLMVHGSSGKKDNIFNPNEQSTINDSRPILADIPGLIEGASTGRGLGDLFLRHIERTSLLVHLIDITGDDLWKNYQTIRLELKNYSRELTRKKEVIVLTKTDLATKDQIDRALEIFKSHRKKVFVISAEKEIGLDNLVKEIYRKV